jgi:uncharacterized repeat protein (TIGR03837 family)
VWMIAPEGAASAALSRFGVPAHDASRRNDHPGGGRREFEIFHVPFLSQDRYDLLLWASDVNFVRGEDSFVRAQWAARPFVWQVYPTVDEAHHAKLAAFLDRYTEGMAPAQAAAVVALWEAWNQGDGALPGEKAAPGLPQSWAAFIARREALLEHARQWCARLAARPDVAAALVNFADKVLELKAFSR